MPAFLGSRTVFMIEDEMLTREFVCALLQGAAGFVWLGGCGSLSAAREILGKSPLPDFLLLDQVLPDGDGAELLDELRVFVSEGRVAVVTGYCDELLYYLVQRYRSVSFVDKTTTTLFDWRRVLNSLSLGRRYCSPSIEAGIANTRSASSHWSRLLTRRELFILHYLGRGWGNCEVAKVTQLSPQTIQVHRKHILNKLGLHSTPELMRWAVRTGFARLRQATLFSECKEAAATA